VVLAWQPAAAAAVALVLAASALRRRRQRWAASTSSVLAELSLISALYALWRYAGSISVMKMDAALTRGRSLWDVERFLHLPSERHVQQLALPHPLIVEACNAYYATVHGPALILFLAWLFVRHRDRYPPVRNVVAMATGACLAIQLVPVAPPRMFRDLGFVDTGLRYHQSVYTAVGRGMADQLSAMPSVHIAWAVLIGVAVVRISTSRWRWLVLAHVVGTALVVVVTANHFWLDGVVAVAVLLAAVAVEAAVRTWRQAARRGRSPTTALPAWIEHA